MTGVVLTVIIPAYNAEKYLPQCLDSVIGQTLKDIEVICVDDGSTDGSASVLQDWPRFNFSSRRHVVHLPRTTIYCHAKR